MFDEFCRRASACLRAASRSIATAFRSPYTRALEEEVARLRAENRALINSILGVAGIPPMRIAARNTAAIARRSRDDAFVGARLSFDSNEAVGSGFSPDPAQCMPPDKQGGPKGRPYTDKIISRAEGNPRVADPNGASVACAPLRRRSWQQIGRALEIEDARAARREREANTETFPPPRQLVVRDS